jgi:hypothetical protein
MKQDTRNYGKFHQRFAEGGAVESKTEKELEKVASGHKPWYATMAEGIKGFARGGAVKEDEMKGDPDPDGGSG